MEKINIEQYLSSLRHEIKTTGNSLEKEEKLDGEKEKLEKEKEAIGKLKEEYSANHTLRG